MQAIKNFVWCSENVFCVIKWQRRSPPLCICMTKYKLSVSWNACTMFTINGWLSWARIFRSFITELILRFERTLGLYISFMANNLPSLYLVTSHTFPNPPLPTGFSNLKSSLDNYLNSLLESISLSFYVPLQLPILFQLILLTKNIVKFNLLFLIYIII